MKKLNWKKLHLAKKKKNKTNQRHQFNLIFCSKPSQSVTVFFLCVPPDPNQCHWNELTCANGPSALKERQFFANLTLIGVRGMKIIMKVHQKMGRVSRAVIFIKNDIEWGPGASTYETFTSAQKSETLMSATLDVVKKCQNQVRKWLCRSAYTQINRRIIIKMFIN